jgi:hypothetical protein
MRTLVFSVVILLICISGRASAREPEYMGLAKKEVVRRLGIPAQICIGNGPEHVMWYYYYRARDGSFRVLAFGFRDGRVVNYSIDPEFEPRRLLSTDRAADLDRIYEELSREKSKK